MTAADLSGIGTSSRLTEETQAGERGVAARFDVKEREEGWSPRGTLRREVTHFFRGCARSRRSRVEAQVEEARQVTGDMEMKQLWEIRLPQPGGPRMRSAGGAGSEGGGNGDMRIAAAERSEGEAGRREAQRKDFSPLHLQQMFGGGGGEEGSVGERGG